MVKFYVDVLQAVTMRGGRFLEAPVSGGKKSAEIGKLVILAAGDRSLYMDAYSCFEAIGKKTFFLGEMFRLLITDWTDFC